MVSTLLQILDFPWLLTEHHTCALAYLKKEGFPVEENCCLQVYDNCLILFSVIDLRMSLSVGFKPHIFLCAKFYGH